MLNEYKLEVSPSKDNVGLVCRLQIGQQVYGYKLKFENGISLDMYCKYINKAKYQLRKIAFMKHKIIIDDFKPELQHIFTNRKTLSRLISSKYTKAQIQSFLDRYEFSEYMYLIPESFYRDYRK